MDSLQPVLDIFEKYPTDPTLQHYYLEELVTSQCKSKHTAYHYKHAVSDFLMWHSWQDDDLPFNEETLRVYANYLEEEGAATDSIGRRLAGIRKLIGKNK